MTTPTPTFDAPVYQGTPLTPGVILSRYLENCQRVVTFTVKGLVNDRHLDEPQVELVGETFDVIATVGELAKMKLVVGQVQAPTADPAAWVRQPWNDSPKPWRER